MSAYLVSTAHIAKIIYWVKTSGTLGCPGYNLYTKLELPGTAGGMAKCLANANIESIKVRYDDAMGYSEDDFAAYTQDVLNMVKTIKPSMLTAADIWNMCQCLDYQSCEVDNWIETDAYWLIHNIQSQAASEMASNAKVKWNDVENFNFQVDDKYINEA